MTPAQLQALEDVERCGDPWARVHGMSQHGGWASVMRILVHERRWIHRVHGEKWALTIDGKAALRAARKAIRVDRQVPRRK